MLSTNELKNNLSDEVTELVAEDIAKAFGTKATNDNLEVDYHLSGGIMKGSLENANTWFRFDTDEGTTIHKVKGIINEIFSEDFDENNEKERKKAEERREIIDSFREQVRILLNSGNYHEQIANTIRNVAHGNVPSEILPLDIICFLEVEIREADKDDFVLIIQKYAEVDPITGQYVNPPQSVQDDLFNTHRETGMEVEDIIKMRKEAGDERYRLVAGVTKKCYSYDVSCDIACDYSLAERPVIHGPRPKRD